MNFRPHVGVNLWLSHIASYLLPIDLCILCTAKKGSCCWPAYKVTGKIHRRKYPRNLGLRDRGSAAIVQVHINGEQDNCAAGRNLPQSTPWKLKVELWKNKEHPLPTPSVGVASVCLFWAETMQLLETESSKSIRTGRCVVWSIFDGYACWYRLYDQELAGTDVPRPGHHLRCLVSDSSPLGNSNLAMRKHDLHREIC